MERQIHGFLYQEDVIERFHIKPSTSYTAKWDGEINIIRNKKDISAQLVIQNFKIL